MSKSEAGVIAFILILLGIGYVFASGYHLIPSVNLSFNFPNSTSIQSQQNNNIQQTCLSQVNYDLNNFFKPKLPSGTPVSIANTQTFTNVNDMYNWLYQWQTNPSIGDCQYSPYYQCSDIATIQNSLSGSSAAGMQPIGVGVAYRVELDSGTPYAYVYIWTAFCDANGNLLSGSANRLTH